MINRSWRRTDLYTQPVVTAANLPERMFSFKGDEGGQIDNAEEKEDASMGIYYSCYTGALTSDGSDLPLGDLRITESCGKLGFSGSSQWGEVWIFEKVEVDGATLSIKVTNDYGEGGEAELTRTDGNAWQTDLFCEGC